MSSESSTSFSKQNVKEKQSRLSLLVSKELDIVVWEKGKKEREKFKAHKFNKIDLLLTVKAYKSTNLKGKSILYSFTINGVNYFGKSSLKYLDGSSFSIDCNEDMFKSERRETFRLLTFPHHEVYCHIPVPPAELTKNKVVDMRTGLSQTGLFKNFLSIVGNEEEFVAQKGFAKYRVLDVSVTGLSFKIGELEKKFVGVGRELEPVFLFFNNEEILIPKANIKHVVPLVDAQGRAFKVGLQFKEVDTNMDELLGKLINDAMRDFESEFEDFLK